MIYNCRLTKLSDNPNATRTPGMEGWTLDLPEAGEKFYIVGKSLTSPENVADYRIIVTSKVQRIENEVFWTENSQYRLEILPMREGT